MTKEHLQRISEELTDSWDFHQSGSNGMEEYAFNHLHKAVALLLSEISELHKKLETQEQTIYRLKAICNYVV